jgi:hypothetical protein
LEFKPFQTLPVAVEAIRLNQHFDVHRPGEVAQHGKPGDWLVHIKDRLYIFTAKKFGELYSPSTRSRISELEAELALLAPLKSKTRDRQSLARQGLRPYSAHDDMPLDLSNPPSSFTAVTPPPSSFTGPLKPETVRALRRVGAILPLPTWDQPKPVRGGRLVAPHARVFFEQVLQEQEAKGLAKYGTPLMTDNGRNPLKDLLGELIDAVMYCSQALMEQLAREDNDAG